MKGFIDLILPACQQPLQIGAGLGGYGGNGSTLLPGEKGRAKTTSTAREE